MFAALLYLLAAGGIVVLLRRIERVPATIATALVLLPLFVTGRALLTGRVYAPLDIAYANEPLTSVADRAGVTHASNPSSTDVYTQFIPWHAATRYAIAHGQWPLWNPFENAGGPLAGASQSAPYHPIHILALLLPLGSALTFVASMLFFIAAVSAFLFMRDLVRYDHAALFGAAAWMFSRHLVAFAGTAHGLALASMPLVLFAARRVVRSPNVRTASLLTGALVLLVLAGHPETTLHVVALSIVYFAFELSRVRFAYWQRAAIAGVAAGGAALLLTAIAIVPLLDAIPQTEQFRFRAQSFAPPALSFERTLHVIRAELLPLVDGTAGVEVASHPKSIAHAWLGSGYCGSLLFALAAYALLRSRGRRARFFIALFAYGLLAGASVFSAPLAHVPLFSIAINERMIWSAAFAMSVLAALAIDAAARAQWTPRRDLLPLIFAITALSVTIAIIAGYSGFVQSGLSPMFIRVSAMRALLPLLLAAAATASIRNSRMVGAMLVALLITQRSADTSNLRPSLPQEALSARFAGLETMTANEPFRIVGQGVMLTPNIATQYELEDVRGYQAMTLARLEDSYPMWSVKQPVWSNRVDDLSSPMLSLMNVRFAITPPRTPLPSGWISRAVFPGYRIAENTRVLPRAFVPARLHFGVTSAESLRAMRSATNFAEEGWIEGGKRESIANGPGVVQIERGGTDLVLHASMAGGGWVIASEPAWRGWRAMEKTRELHVRNADGTFIAFYLPQGEHTIHLVFLPHAFVIGRAITLATLALMLAAMIARIRFARAARRSTILVPVPVAATN
jgi:hypothetical protein